MTNIKVNIRFVCSLLFMTLFHSFFLLQAQEVTISGRVTEAETTDPLPGATVMEQGTQNGTITGPDGNYTLTVSSRDAVIRFSFVGYKPQEVPVGEKTTINVALEKETVGLEDVVVIGYGTVRKSDLTGSVAQVRGEDLVQIPSSEPMQALQGKVSGVQISNASGDPGESPTVRVRGVGSFNSGVNPIYVVDGVIVEDISFLNSSDIYSIEVLKDASATAIYGSRGANGVFIITTKMGGQNVEPEISFKTEHSIQNLEKKLDLLNGKEFARALNDIQPGSVNNVDAVPSYDWQDAIFQENPLIQSYDLSVAGGMEKLGYYFGVGMIDNEGIIPKSDLKRYTFKLNTDYQAKEYLRFGTNISLAYRDKQNAPNLVNTAYRAWPIHEPYDNQKNFKEVNPSNPLASLEYSNNFTKGFRTVGNMFGELTILKKFRLKSSFQLDYNYDKNRNFSPEFFVSPIQNNQTSALSLNQAEDRSWIWENTLNYDNEIGVHRINALAGFTAQENYFENGSGTVYELLRENELFWYLNGTTKPDSVRVNGSAYETSIMSFIFRTNYSYNDKYLLTVTFRADGSSKFSENRDNRWGYFPSFAAGWNISREPFFPEIVIMDNLKIRASYGVIGNENVNWGSRFSRINSARGAVFGEDENLQSGATYGAAGNDDIRWESTYSTDIGIEFRGFNGRLNTELDYYVKETQDILVDLDLQRYFGNGSFAQATFNAANVVNRGLEFNSTWKHAINTNWNYGINAQLTTVHNEVLSMGSGNPTDSILYGGQLGTGERVTATTVGRPIGAFQGYTIDGIFQNQQDLNTYPTRTGQGVGDLIYHDTNGDGEINEKDKVMIGSPIPDLIYGFGFRAGYKNLSLNIDFQGQFGNEIYNGKNQTRFTIYNFESRVKERWTPTNPSNSEPRLNSLAGNYEDSEYYIEDGSYLRLRTLRITYDLPEGLLNRIGLKKTSLYVRGTNLFTFTDYSGYTPDIGGSALSAGIDNGVYPVTRVFSLGMNITL